MAMLIKADGTEEEFNDLRLASLQAAVGGYIETVMTNREGMILILDEEGKLKGKPVNLKATMLTRGIVAHDDLIVGDVVLVEADTFERVEPTTGVVEEAVDADTYGGQQ